MRIIIPSLSVNCETSLQIVTAPITILSLQ
jgi:hypothetical protein